MRIAGTKWSGRRGRHGRRGTTLVETMIALSIGASVLSFTAFLTLFAAKSERILSPQMNGQMSAAYASQAIADILRNAFIASIVINPSNRIEFEQSGPTFGQTSAIAFSNGKIFYYPDESDTDKFWELGRYIENLEFTLVESDQMIEVSVRFVYRKYRGFDQTSDEQLNGVFRSRIYPRNSE